MQFIKQRAAFTLIELVMVVCIIGMMAIFVIPNYSKSVSKTYEKAALNNLTIMYSAQKLKANNGSNYQTAANLADVNTNLGLGVIANGVTYTCPSATAATSFECRAVYSTCTLKVTQASPDACYCGTCWMTTTVCGTCP